MEGCWLTSAVREAVEDVAFVAVALEAAGRVDAEVVAGPVERALVDVCPERGTGQDRQSAASQTVHQNDNPSFQRRLSPINAHFTVFAFRARLCSLFTGRIGSSLHNT